MKKITIISLLIVLSSCSWLQPKYKSGKEGQMLPSFNLILKDDSTKQFNTTSIAPNNSFMVFLFQSGCSFCQAQTVDILNNITAIKNNNLYLITKDSYK